MHRTSSIPEYQFRPKSTNFRNWRIRFRQLPDDAQDRDDEQLEASVLQVLVVLLLVLLLVVVVLLLLVLLPCSRAADRSGRRQRLSKRQRERQAHEQAERHTDRTQSTTRPRLVAANW